MKRFYLKQKLTRKNLYFSIVSLPLLCAGLIFSLSIVNRKESIDLRSEASEKKIQIDKYKSRDNKELAKISKYEVMIDDPSNAKRRAQGDLPSPQDVSTPPQTVYTSAFLNEPLIGMINNNTFQVNLRAKVEGAKVKIAYGINNLNSTTEEYISNNNNEQSNVLEIPLTGIQPNKEYQYQITWSFRAREGEGEIFTGPVHTFQSPRASGKEFKFGVFGDSRQPTLHDYVNCIPADLYNSTGELIKHMGTKNYDFTLSLGDDWELQHFAEECREPDEFTMDNALKAIGYWRDDMDRTHHSMPHFMTPGNHEYDVQWHGGFRVDRSHKARLLSTINPLNYNAADGDDETYYSFEWGDALFISLNSEFEGYIEPEGHSFQWAENVLKNSDAIWKIVFLHRPLYGAQGNKILPDGSVVEGLMNLFEEHEVDVVFQAHAHSYGCTTYNPMDSSTDCFKNLNKKDENKNKITYYILSGGGGVNGPIRRPGVLQYLDVTINPYDLKVKCINPLTGDLCDLPNNQFEISKVETGGPDPVPPRPSPVPDQLDPTPIPVTKKKGIPIINFSTNENLDRGLPEKIYIKFIDANNEEYTNKSNVISL